MKYTKEERERAIETLKTWIHEGDKVYVIVRRISESGMTTKLSVHAFFSEEGRVETRDATPNVAIVLGQSVSNSSPRWESTVKVNGTGFNKAQHLVDEIAHALGYKTLKAEVL